MRTIYYLPVALLLFSSISYAQLQPITYFDNDQLLNGLGVKPLKKSSENPGILLLPAWMGIDQASKDIADKLSAMGYYSFIADIYGEDNYPKDSAEAGKFAGFYKSNYLEYQRRIELALDQLILLGANPDNVVIIGYCFGGTGALEAARGHLNVKGVVSFHGGLSKNVSRPTEMITTKVLVCHGADDPFESKDKIASFQQEMKESKADWQMIYYANAVHSFTNPAAGTDNSKGAAYNEIADKRSWEHLKLFLDDVLLK